MANAGGGGGGAGGIRAGKAFVELAAKDAGLSSMLDRMKRKVQAFGASTAKIGLGMAALGGAGLTAGLSAVTNTLDEMGRMEEVARAFGLTSEKASGLFSMLQQNGGAVKENMEALSQFGSRVAEFMQGADADSMSGKLFGGLGITKEDLKNAGDIADQLFLTFGKVNDLTKTDAGKANGLFDLIGGTDSSKQLKAVMNRSEAELRAMAKAGQMSAEDMNAAREANIAYKNSLLALEQAWKQVAVALAPTIQMLAEKAVPLFKDLAAWVKDNRALIVGLAAGLAAFTGVGLTLAGVGIAINGLVMGLSALGAVLGVVFSPVGLGVAVIGTFLTVLMAAGEEINTSRSSITMLGEDFSKSWQAIKDALAAGDLEGAMSAVTKGMAVLWDDMTVGIVEGWHRAITEIKVGVAAVSNWILDTFGRVLRQESIRKLLNLAGGLGFAVLGGANGVGEDDIRREADAARKAREAARDARRKDRDDQAGDLRANRVLKENDAMMDKFLKDMMAAAKVTTAVAGLRAAQELGASSRGTFTGSGAGQELSAGGIWRTIADNTKATADNTEKIAAGMGIGE